MPLQPGTTLGPYQIDAPLGAGGMGEVYKATDTRLDRTVAIKVLPTHVADDPDLRQRFEREAKTISSLNHPHICTLHDIGNQDGIDYLVMEYLDGETLAERLEKGALPLDQALQIAIAIADALDKAHRQGIVHRDLKPGNIMLTKAGAKLLDFGLAKLRKPGSVGAEGFSAATTASEPLTARGTLLGTLPYMAPEQLEGKEADARTDIFAFGAVLYEMATGKRAFMGDSQASLIAAILDREPVSLMTLQPMTPVALDRIVKTCLAKDAEDRWQSMSDVSHQLRWTLETLAAPPAADSASAAAPTRPAFLARAVPWAVAALLAATLGVVWMTPSTETPAAAVRMAIPLPTGQQVTGQIGLPLAIAPNGRTLAYTTREAGTTRLYLRTLAETDVRAVPQTDGARIPFFSPDGEWVGFWADGTLYRVPASGGQPLPIGDASGLEFGAAWGPGETIVFATIDGLYRIPATGGQAEAISSGGAQEQGSFPQFLPDGGLLVVRDGAVVRLDLTTLDAETLWRPAEPIKQARYVASGHLVYGSAGDIIALSFDLDRLEATGAPVPVAQDLFEGARGSGAVYFASSDEGTMLFVNGGVAHGLVLVDRDGRSRPLAQERAAFRLPAFAPDGARVSVAIDDDPRPSHIWLYELQGRRERLTSEFHNLSSVFTPDGTAVAFSSRGAPYLKSLHTTAEVEPLLTPEQDTPYNQPPGSFSPDGRFLVFTEQHPVTRNDLWLLDLSTEPPTSRPLLVTPFSERDPRISPDGRWLAYQSDRTGRTQVHVRPYQSDRTGRTQVHVRPFRVDGSDRTISVNGGSEPRWSADSAEFFFRNGDLMMVADVQAGDNLVTSEPRVLFEARYDASDGINYDVSPDGKTFVMIETDPSGDGRRLEVILNWHEELKVRVPID